MIELNMIGHTSSIFKDDRFRPHGKGYPFSIKEGEIVMLKNDYGETLPLLACLGKGHTCPSCIFYVHSKAESSIAARKFTFSCPHLPNSSTTICDLIKRSYPNGGYFTSVEDLI